MVLIYKTRGASALIEWTKSTRAALMLHLSNEFPSKSVKGVPVYKDGFPKVLGRELHSLRSDTTHLRLVLTILFSTRILQVGTTPSTVSIESGAKASPCDLTVHMKSFWRHLGYRPCIKVPRALYFKNFHMTTKAGPNLGSALWGSMIDLELLSKDSNVLEALAILGGPKLARFLTVLSSNLQRLPRSLFAREGRTLRRLAWFPDKENKVRVVAILDFWSQTALRPLHDYLFRILRKIPQDCTFDQGSFKEKSKNWTYYASIDLTAATDRFPIKIIEELLGVHLPESYVSSWRTIMVGLPFRFNNRNVSYAVGNPMGAYSSWNSFALAHHYILFWCCKELKIDFSTAPYCLLGDDIVIGRKDLADKYKEVLTLLGVEFSDLKTHESSSLFEFAKRIVWRGHEITPFPCSSLVESVKKHFLLFNLLAEEERKDWVCSRGIPFAIHSFFSEVLGLNRRFCAKIHERTTALKNITDVMRGRVTCLDGLKAILDFLSVPLLLDKAAAERLFSDVSKEVFFASEPFNPDGGEPLGLVAEALVIEITSVEEWTGAEVFDIPVMIPLLAIYGSVEEKYMELRRKAFSVEGLWSRDWDMHLRALTLPFSDRVFSERATHTIVRVTSVFADKVLKVVRNLEIDSNAVDPILPPPVTGD